MSNAQNEHWHRRLIEGNSGKLAVFTVIGISIGGLAEIVPMYTVAAAPEVMSEVAPYTPLELAGRDIYSREGCVQCHSQWVRPFRSETMRYGPWSRGGEYVYDRPFLLGSRRIGPDLHRVGGKYPDSWHFDHMRDPRTTSPGSIMPPYPWLYEDSIDYEDAAKTVAAMQTLGVPYSDEEVANAPAAMKAQGEEIVKSLAGENATTTADKEIVALIAYLQRLGTDGRATLAAREAGEGPTAVGDAAPADSGAGE